MDKRISFVFLSLEASGLSYTFIGIACVRKNACKISFALKNFCNLDQIVRVGLNAGSVSVDVDFNQDRARDLSFFCNKLLNCSAASLLSRITFKSQPASLKFTARSNFPGEMPTA